MIEITPIYLCPEWVIYPKLYIELSNGNITDFLPWYLMRHEQIFIRVAHLKKLYKRELYPFARRDYTDDVACWEKGQGEKVFIIHDFASSGFEQREIFNNFDEWYQWALQQVE